MLEYFFAVALDFSACVRPPDAYGGSVLTASNVLGHFSKDDRAKMQEGYIRAMHAAEMLVAGDVEQAMNEYNKKAKQEA